MKKGPQILPNKMLKSLNRFFSFFSRQTTKGCVMHDLLAYGSPRQKKARTHENCARRLKTVRGARARFLRAALARILGRASLSYDPAPQTFNFQN